MCDRTDAMRAVREAACTLSAACLGIETSLLPDGCISRSLPMPPKEFGDLLKRLDQRTFNQT
ncbi:hypothetical protein [Sphingosinicella rhizophila]|uniref:Uncharacterized protein n=1 Tax=Sphingosinicella rhizophila TaxID=3050082 RepID=A0ABU3QBA3_9SPHN|nr:hypothetical protein [Sphingosinicella sp. GR2756]MDT9600298.1 hypothetical protein [Sphingosinicella sp. GR2756]